MVYLLVGVGVGVGVGGKGTHLGGHGARLQKTTRHVVPDPHGDLCNRNTWRPL